MHDLVGGLSPRGAVLGRLLGGFEACVHSMLVLDTHPAPRWRSTPPSGNGKPEMRLTSCSRFSDVVAWIGREALLCDRDKIA